MIWQGSLREQLFSPRKTTSTSDEITKHHLKQCDCGIQQCPISCSYCYVSLRMCKYWCTHLTGSEQRTECHNIVNTTCRLAAVESQTSLLGRVSVSSPSIRGISIGYKLLARELWKRIALLNHLKQTSPVLALEKAGYPLTYRTKVQSIVFIHLDWYYSVNRFIKQIKKIKYHCKEIRSINGYFVSIKLKPVVNTY